MSEYNLIVIGAGNAGLATAATASKNGLRTLVIERNIIPGGCATSFVRGRYEFETSLHELANVGTEDNPGSVRKLFDSYNADVTWINETNAFRVIADGENGYDVTMPSGIQEFCDEIEREVPGSRESVETLFKYAEKVEAALSYMSSGNMDPQVMREKHSDFLKMVSYSVDECLDAMKMPKKAQNIVKTYWPYLGASMKQMDMAHYLLMMSRYIAGSPAMPLMRSHELSVSLDDVIKKSGGDIWYNTEVDEILVKDGKAYGVRVGNQEIYADYVVANCFPETAYTKMMDAESVPERAIKLVNAREKGELFFTVYLGLNRSCGELGIKDYSVFLYNSPDTEEQYASMNDVDNSFVIVNCLNNVIPDCTPDGTCMLFLTTMFTESVWEGVTVEDYKEMKNRIAGRMIETYEKKLGISVMPYIEEIAIATPSTFARYLGTPHGTPYGYEVKSWDTMIARIINGAREQFTENLFFVGAHGDRADGYSSAYSNGNSTAGRILREAKKNGKA